MDPNPITNTEDIRSPRRPSNPFPLSHSTMTDGTVDMTSLGYCPRRLLSSLVSPTCNGPFGSNRMFVDVSVCLSIGMFEGGNEDVEDRNFCSSFFVADLGVDPDELE